MEHLFDIGPAAERCPREKKRPAPVEYSATEQLAVLPEAYPEFAQMREDLYTIGECPVDPAVQPCPLVGCSYHCFSLSRADDGKGAEELVEELFAMPHTCILQLCHDHADGLSVDELKPVMRLQAQTIRDMERDAFMSPVFDEVIEKLEDIIDDDIPTGTRIMALRGLLMPARMTSNEDHTIYADE